MWDLLCFYFRVIFFFLNLLDIQEQCLRKLGKIRSELKLLYGIYYWFLKLYTRILWHSYFPLHGISQPKGSGWSGAKWVNTNPEWYSILPLQMSFMCTSIFLIPCCLWLFHLAQPEIHRSNMLACTSQTIHFVAMLLHLNKKQSSHSTWSP